jgi:hypothetical protein
MHLHKTVFILITCGLFFSPQFLPAQETDASKWFIGGFIGGSHGWGSYFTWTHGPWVSHKSSLGFHVGGTLRYEFSPKIGAQLEANYQSGVNEWIEHRWGAEEKKGEDLFSVFSISAQAVSHFYEIQRLRFYLLGGMGISNGKWGVYGVFHGQYYHYIIGTGVKIKLRESKPRLALHLGGSFIRYYKPMTHEQDRMLTDFVRFLAGVEF